MFKIKFRIVDDIESLSSITAKTFDYEYDQILGFFQMHFGTHQEGSYYHENPLERGESGGELLDYWFDKLLQTIILLDQGFNYVAFKEIETVNRWIEIVKRDDNLLLNVAIDDSCKNNNLMLTTKYLFSYIEPLDFTISYKEFKMGVLEMAKEFFVELKKINEELTYTQMGKTLRRKLSIVSK